ncbi:helicase [Streptomyces sp. LD120]|uniref:Helicase n=1 Tax=Streptomyces physcomitrii TaxID=2724184 RepID=A0ABX1H2K2_9ACTN|nr:helicase [Streptomyces physcomitrii]
MLCWARGIDVGTWNTRQTSPAVWDTLSPEQRERLEALGLTRRTDTAPATTAAGKSGKGTAFERGIAALAQFVQREGHLKVSRQHIETVVIDGQEHAVKAGVFLSNHKSRRARLSAEQRAALCIDWATT